MGYVFYTIERVHACLSVSVSLCIIYASMIIIIMKTSKAQIQSKIVLSAVQNTLHYDRTNKKRYSHVHSLNQY